MAKLVTLFVLIFGLICGFQCRQIKGIQTTTAPTIQNQETRPAVIEEEIFNLGARVFNLTQRLQKDPKDENQLPNNYVMSPVGLGIGLGQLHLAANSDLKILIAEHLFNWNNGPDFLHKNLSAVIKKLTRDPPVTNQIKSSKPKALVNIESNDVDIEIDLHTAIFYQEKEALLDDQFKNDSETHYKTDFVAFNENESSARRQHRVNEWVRKSTRNIITEFPVPSSFLVMIANAICFEGDWEYPFSDEFTKVAPFWASPTRNVSATYMRGQEEVPYYENIDLKYKMIRLPYVIRDAEKKNVSMYIISPSGHNLKEIMMNLSFSELKAIIKERMEEYPVNIQLPKVEIRESVKVKQLLDSLMLEEKTKRIWTREVKRTPSPVLHYELTAASSNKDFVLTDFVQETALNVFEKGTSAASVTASYINYSGQAKMFKVEQPYLMLIYDDKNDLVLFYGAIFNPTTSSS